MNLTSLTLVSCPDTLKKVKGQPSAPPKNSTHLKNIAFCPNKSVDF